MGPFSQDWTEADVEAVLARDDPAELLYVPIVIGMSASDCERSWVENICFKLTEHQDFNVRGNALLGLGHIARTCRELDLARALPIISRALSDSNEYARSHANNAACDLQIYMGVEVPGYDTTYTDELLAAAQKLRPAKDA